MSEDTNIDRFVKDPSLLVKLCREVTYEIDAGSDSAEIRERETQLREISKTIERMEKAGVSIPDVLRSEKARLITFISIQTNASHTLNMLADEFDDIVKKLRKVRPDQSHSTFVRKPRTNNPSIRTSGRRPNVGFISEKEWVSIPQSEKDQYSMEYDGEKISLVDVNGEDHVCKSITALIRHERGEGHQRSRSPKTSEKELRRYILISLKKLGGRASVLDVMDEMGRQMEGKLLPGDTEWREGTADYVWQNNAKWGRFRMTKEGILRSDSPRGIWELTEEYK